MIGMPEPGKLFVFEGPDGSGKTTLSTALVEHLKRTGPGGRYFAFPGHQVGTLGKLVHGLHHDPKAAGIESITPTSLQLLHVAAHIDAIESSILPTLRSGQDVVLDRFWWSTWVYGKVTGANPQALKAMIELEKFAWQGVHPTIVFLMQRAASTYECTTQGRRRVEAEYTRLAGREAGRYPVRNIENEGSLAHSLSHLLSQLRRHGNINETPTDANRHTVDKAPYQRRLPLRSKGGGTRAPLVFARLAPAKTTAVYDTYWRFAAERQRIFFRRLDGELSPWTKDSVLLEHKFTNAYRASDRVSQYLIREVIYKGDQSPDEVFFRVLLFKLFNKIETWELLVHELKDLSFADYSFARYDQVMGRAVSEGVRIYSGAYIMPSGGASVVGDKKYRMHLQLLERMIRDELPARLAEAPSMRNAFELLHSYPTIGDFLGYQYVTDLNYSTLLNFTEMEFVVPGPGARDGIRKCFEDLGGLTESEIIKVVAERQQAEFSRLGLEFQSLWGRPLQLIDCQNLFCEVDKYARVAHPEISGITGRKRIKQKYRINPTPILFWYPPKWGLNGRIACEEKYVSSL
jgi:thymidylate kinase